MSELSVFVILRGIAVLRRSLADRGVSPPAIHITGNDRHADRMAAIESGCMPI